MKSLKLLTLLFLATLAYGQEGENYITIVGQSSESVEPIGIQAKFTIEEVERNEYQKVQARTLDDVRLDLMNLLQSNGYKKDNLVELLPHTYSYNSTVNENYRIIFKTLDDLKSIKQGAFSGFTISEVLYAYDSKRNVDDKKLANQAIDDARRKAEALAKHVNKKVGQVLSVEDRSYSRLFIPETSRFEEYTIKYEIAITFELLNK